MPHPVDIHVGKRLRLRRNILGLSQEQVGDTLGVTFQQVQKNERGVNRLAASRLHQLSVVLKCPVGYFFEELDAPVVDKEQNEIMSRETLEMVRAYYGIPEETVRKKIFELIKSLGGHS